MMEVMADESNDTATSSMETAWEMSSIKTLAGDNNAVEMSSLESTCEMDTLNSQSATCEMNTPGATCEMNALNIEGSTCEMNTQGATCEMKTQGSTCEMNTQGTTCEMNTQDTTCEMTTLNTEGTTCDVNTLENVDQCNGTVEMNIVGSTCKMNTVEIVVDEGSKTDSLNSKRPAESGGVSSIRNNLEMTDTEDTFDDPPSKKMRLELNEPASDSSTVSPQSAKDTVADPSCKKVQLKIDEPASNSSAISPQSAKDTVADPPCKKIQLNEPASDSSTISPQSAKGTVADPSCKKVQLKIDEPASDSSTISPQSAKDTVKDSVKNDKVPENNDVQPVGPGGDNDSSCKPCGASAQSNTKQGSFEKPSPLTEIQAGITEYMGSHKGFSAIIKQRYSDFIVNEIDLQGNVVHLTQMNLENLDEEPGAESKQEDKKITADVISDEDIAKLEDLVKNEDKKASVNIIAPPDKEARTKIHLAVKKAYAQLETKTAEVDGQKVIQVLWKSGKSRGNNRDDWPEAKKDFKYVKFILYKENKDTMDAIGLIANNLKLKENLFQYAGTKDKRAKTSQEITAHRIHPKKLSFMNKVLRNIGLGNFQFVKEPLKLGQLAGNQFTIVLRNVIASSETVDSAISSLKTLGFVNYFGMQRFGTTSVPTHKVGCALLHGDWEKAVDLILMPRDDNPSKDAFQKVWMETRDPVATLKVTPPFCGLERNLLEALKRKMKPLNALEKISRNTRLLYIHSYQALVWNKMVSKRLKVFGMKPVVGDLAMKDDSENTEKKSPVVITQDNLDQFSIHDVVLPLPGYDVIYPKNDIHSWYRETLAEDGLDIDNMRRPQKDYSLPGAYRPVTVCPSSVSWSHHRYDDCSLPLTLSDMDVINEVKLPASHNKGKFKAVILKMNLPSSCYATMALREVLRVDTSVAHQTSLNVT